MSTETELKQNFKIKSKARPFKALTSVINVMTEEATINLKIEGIQTNMIDPSRKEMVMINWPKEKFPEYEVDYSAEEEKIPISFYVSILSAIFRRFSNDDDILLESTDKNTLKITNLTNGKEFDCTPITGNMDTDTLPKVALDYEFNLIISQFEEMIADSEVFRAEEAWLENENGKLVFKGKGDGGTAKGILLREFKETIDDTAFRFEYLKPFLGAIKPYVEGEIVVKVGPQKPLHLDLNIGEGFILEYLLAPKTSRS